MDKYTLKKLKQQGKAEQSDMLRLFGIRMVAYEAFLKDPEGEPLGESHTAEVTAWANGRYALSQSTGKWVLLPERNTEPVAMPLRPTVGNHAKTDYTAGEVGAGPTLLRGPQRIPDLTPQQLDERNRRIAREAEEKKKSLAARLNPFKDRPKTPPQSLPTYGA